MMNKMDFLLLTIVPQNFYRDISSFTSPLKLYEYSSTGRVIIASDIPVLRDELEDTQVFFSKNTVSDFCNSIKHLSKSSIQRRLISESELKLAKVSTWTSRANYIIEKITNA